MSEISLFLITAMMVFGAAAVQGAVGFGFSLIAVPLLAILLPVKTTVPLIVCCSLANNLMVALEARKHTDIKRIWPMMVFGVLGIPIGVAALTYLNTDVLRLMMGFVIVVTSIAMVFGYTVHLRNERTAMGIAGFFSGMLNGALSMSGPPVVLFMSNQKAEKDVFRSNLALYSIVTNIITIGAFMIKGIISASLLPLLGVNLVGLALGTALGIKASKAIQETHFRKTVLTLMGMIGVVTIINTL